MGAGILPVAIHNNNLYFLLSRENTYDKFKHSGQWSDFGGKSEKNEKPIQTAAREGWEESMDFLGNENYIKHLLKNNVLKKISTKKYHCYVVLIKYDSNLPKKFREHWVKQYKKDPEYILEENGFYEKDMLKWIRLDKLHIYLKKPNFFRHWYKEIVKEVISNFSIS